MESSVDLFFLGVGVKGCAEDAGDAADDGRGDHCCASPSSSSEASSLDSVQYARRLNNIAHKVYAKRLGPRYKLEPGPHRNHLDTNDHGDAQEL